MKRLWAGLILLWAPVSISAQKPGAEVRAMQQFTDIVQPDDGTKACRDTGTNWMGLATFTCVRSNSRPDTVTVSADPETNYRSVFYSSNRLSSKDAAALRDSLAAWARPMGGSITECTIDNSAESPATGIYFRFKEFSVSYTRRFYPDSSVRTWAQFITPISPSLADVCRGSARHTGEQ